MIKKLLTAVQKQKVEREQANQYRDMIRAEALIGGKLFGVVPQGHRREFFCLDKHTWIWHEEWLDENSIRQVRTTRYDVRPDVILKAQDGTAYRAVDRQEANNLIKAAKAYYSAVTSQLYQNA